MRVLQVEIENFRGVKKGTVVFPGHALVIGPNNVGKSTVLEALDLVLGPERYSGPTTIDEHDFHLGQYLAPEAGLDADDEPGEGRARAPEITITVTLSSLADDELTKFRGRVEPWNAAGGRVYTADEASALPSTFADHVLRLRFRGWYDPEDDEFKAETVYLNPAREDGSLDAIGKTDKRRIGFLYLRALRTAKRAASLQRGSMLDLLLKIAEAEPRFWQDVITSLNALGETTGKEAGLRGILDEIEASIGAYVPGRKPGAPPSRLNVTELTREQLRTVMTYFLADHASGHLLPYDRLGSGVTNLLVLALLTLMAKRKQNVIFAMEEPEIALGPTVQRRIVAKLKEVATQSLVTSHSPYVAEQFLPDSIVVLRRSGGTLDSRTTSATPELKEKILRQSFRTRFAEGLLGNAVLIVEGDTEILAVPAASDVLASTEGTAYRSLDVLGIVPVGAGGDGDLAKVVSFFVNAGVKTFVFCDKLNDTEMLARITNAGGDVHEHPFKNLENLVVTDLPLVALQRQVRALSQRADYCKDEKLPEDAASEAQWRDCLRNILKKRKGYGYAALVLKDCQPTELPPAMRKYLGKLHMHVAGAAVPPGDPLHALLT